MVLGDGQQGPVISPAPFARAQPSGTLSVQEGMRALRWSLPRDWRWDLAPGWKPAEPAGARRRST